jgi:hypothetical protein
MLLSGVAWAGESAELGAAELGSPIQEQALDQQRGGESSRLELNWQETNGTVEGNRAINTSNGPNSISDGAFSHASGLPIAVQNSGNNVLIQNSVILNLRLQ